ncbi:uncharacterized protein ACIB01_007147 isoform 1-T1 [Guaruba guarouba]
MTDSTGLTALPLCPATGPGTWAPPCRRGSSVPARRKLNPLPYRRERDTEKLSRQEDAHMTTHFVLGKQLQERRKHWGDERSLSHHLLTASATIPSKPSCYRLCPTSQALGPGPGAGSLCLSAGKNAIPENHSTDLWSKTSFQLITVHGKNKSSQTN